MGKPPRSRTDSTSPDTRRQLLIAAASVFAGRGFHHATVRDICRIAGANLAAIRYHFGDKESLYTAVLHETAPPPATPPVGSALPPPSFQLRTFIHTFLARIAEEGVSGHHGCIMAREMVDPTPALDDLVQNFIRPQHDWLQRLVRDLAGPGFSPAEIRRIAHSIVSQVLFYKHCHAVLIRLAPQDCLTPSNLDLVADHITRFSLAAITSFKASNRSSSSSSAPVRKPSRPQPSR